MNWNKRDLVEFLIRVNALRFGDFTLKSGAWSPFFINLGDVASGEDFNILGEFISRGLEEHFPTANHLFGPAYKGISMATAGAMAHHRRTNTNLPVFYDRKEAKDHGEGGSYIGSKPYAESRIVLVDDVVTSGGTKVEAMEALQRDFGAAPLGTLVIVDRTTRNTAVDKDALKLQSLINLEDMAQTLKQQGDDRWETIVRYCEEA